MPPFQICPSLGMNQHSVKLKLAKGWITQSKYPQVVRKIGLFWQFPQISRPVLAPVLALTPNQAQGLAPCHSCVLLALLPLSSLSTARAVCSVPTEQRSRAVHRTVLQRAVQSSIAGVDSVSGFASGPCHALLCYALLYFMLCIGWMVYHTM